jgi:hypothetical protein
MPIQDRRKRSLERALTEEGTKLAVDRALDLQRRYGSQGPASPVRRIDPRTGEVVEVLEARKPGARRPRSRLMTTEEAAWTFTSPSSVNVAGLRLPRSALAPLVSNLDDAVMCRIPDRLA